MADPFADRNTLDSNPFADPTKPSSSYQQHNPSSYVPSDEDYENQSHSPYQSTPQSSSFNTQNVDRNEANRLEELARRERELEQRERDLQNRASHIQKHGRNNWPFFYPLIYHDISAEIPADAQPTMLNLYRLWLLLILTLILNLVGCILLLVQGASDGAKDMINSIVYLPIISIASFLLWYRPIYNGFMKEHSIFYYMYFLFCGFHLLFSLYLFLGIPSTGSCGLLNTISSFTGGRIVSAIIGTITTVAMAIQGLGNAWYYREIWKHNNEQGHTFAQAKAELASHGAKAYFTRGSQV